MGGPAIINGKPYTKLDNFYVRPFTYEGKQWMSSEHLYQALKFKSEQYREAIRQADTVHEAWGAGQSRDHELIDNFEERKTELMYIANRAKIDGNDDIRTELLSSTGSICVQQSSSFWNVANGKILERIRDELIREAVIDDLPTDQTLFRRYEISFSEFNADGMIEVKKVWKRRNPGKEFYKEYSRRVNVYHNLL